MKGTNSLRYSWMAFNLMFSPRHVPKSQWIVFCETVCLTIYTFLFKIQALYEGKNQKLVVWAKLSKETEMWCILYFFPYQKGIWNWERPIYLQAKKSTFSVQMLILHWDMHQIKEIKQDLHNCPSRGRKGNSFHRYTYQRCLLHSNFLVNTQSVLFPDIVTARFSYLFLLPNQQNQKQNRKLLNY